MIIKKNECKDDVYIVTIGIEPEEFQRSLTEAYLKNTDKYPVPGVVPGLATRSSIEGIYGENALYDEALEICVSEMYWDHINSGSVSIIGKPKLTEVNWEEDDSIVFTVICDCYPEVILGKYKGIEVPVRRSEDEEQFAAAVLMKACSQIEAKIPDGMVEQKLDAMEAQEKFKLSQDPIYHVLSDALAILDKAYRECGVNRPASQIRAEALDIMLQTISKDNEAFSEESFVERIKEAVGRYCTLPENIDQMMSEIIENRAGKKRSMTPDEKADAAFVAYLASIDLNEQQWRKERRQQATDSVRFDLLFQEVAKQEKLSVDPEELQEAYGLIAEQCDMELEEVIAEIDSEPIRAQILRDKARLLILDHAVTLSQKCEEDN